MIKSIGYLVGLSKEDIELQFVWVDWRASAREIIDALNASFTVHTLLLISENEKEVSISYSGNQLNFIKPMPHLDVDRFLYWLSQNIRREYELWVERESFGGSDTIGVLVLKNDDSRYLLRRYPDWVRKHIRAIPSDKSSSSFKHIIARIDAIERVMLRYWWVLPLVLFAYIVSKMG